MVGKLRTVYFYTGVESDEEEQPHDWNHAKWTEYIRNFGNSAVTLHIKGSNCTGEVKSNAAPAAQFLHLMRERALSDWPEGKDINGTVSNLGANRQTLGISEIYEYSYLLPVDGTPYVAMFRSSGGPRPGLIEDWISTNLDLPKSGKTFRLVPVLRKNAIKRLREAVGVKKLYARFEGDVQTNSGSKVQDAAAMAGSIPGLNEYADGMIEIVVSLGRSVKTGPGIDSIMNETNKILNQADGGLTQRTVTKLVATTLQKKDDKIVSEPVDFMKERMTISVAFGNSINDVMTPNEILSGMFVAIREFRQRTGEYSY